MNQLTIRGFDKALARHLRKLARDEGISLNKAALRLLRRGAGLEEPTAGPDIVGTSLDHLIGTWTDEQADELASAVEDFEVIDEALWQ
jgi:hypothetical protein